MAGSLYNWRQGYRAEHLAQYILSEFGPCERVLHENDYGIDLVANLMRKNGTVVSELFGIQVKSGNESFKYEGEYLMEWIMSYNVPIFMCKADRNLFKIDLYSTWTLNHLIWEFGNRQIKTITFLPEYGNNDSLKLPEVNNENATIWMGKPIVSISTDELKKGEVIDECRNVLSEWVKFDSENYSRRQIGLSIVFGYCAWETNKSINTSLRQFYKPYHFNDFNSDKAIKIIQECATLIAMNKGKDASITKDLAKFISDHGKDIAEFTRDVLNIKKE